MIAIMAEKFDVYVSYDEAEEIMKKLKKRRLYSSDSLYRVLTIEDDISSRAREILRRGTDRTSDKILGDEDEGYFNLMERDTL